MPKIIPAKKKIDAMANGCFLIALGILFFTNTWWPGILLALWVMLAIRQYLSNRIYDLVVTSFILIGLFIISTFKWFDWSIIMPVAFVVGGIYIIFREYFFTEDTNGEDPSQEIKDDSDIDKPSI